MQLYATIKKSSKYYEQNSLAQRDATIFGGFPFPISINPDDLGERDNYCVKGGPGGQYRLIDVHLYVKRSDGEAVRIR